MMGNRSYMAFDRGQEKEIGEPRHVGEYLF